MTPETVTFAEMLFQYFGTTENVQFYILVTLFCRVQLAYISSLHRMNVNDC